MKNKLSIVLISLFALIFVLVFYRWFFLSEIIGGDWPYFFKENLKEFTFIVPSWNTWYANGMGGTSPFFSLQTFNNFTVSLAYFFNIPWVVIYKIFWFGLFILLSIASSIYLVNSISSKLNIWQKLTASVIFSTNTYILMLVGGGQMGVALAYSIAPLVLGIFIKLINLISLLGLNSKFKIQNSKFSIIAGMVLSIQILFDPRIAYLSMLIVGIYIIFSLLFVKFFSKNIFPFFLYLMFFGLGVPVLTTILLHAVWIFPILFFQSSPIPQGLINVDGFRFFSFADFSHSFSMLHPNWPENIFGKVYFMRSEFILMPILAFSSLLFLINSTIKQYSNKSILFFALLGIIGAFMAKGANPPFGEINTFLFEHIPGMNVFRDPTKFYLLVALSYSVLIPFSIYSIYKWLSAKCKVQSAKLQFKVKSYMPELFLLLTICYLLFLIRPAIFGQLGGTFSEREVPPEYVKLKDFLYQQPDFFRTLWVPRQSRFTFVSNAHPSVEAIPLFNVISSEEAIQKLRKEGSVYLADLSIKYVIVPYDSMGEFFLTDRKYDKTIPEKISKSLETIPWLKKLDGFGNITIFEVPSPKDHFWLEKSGKSSYKMISPTSYLITVSITNSQKLIFSEKYGQSWVAKINGKTINSERTPIGLNSFVLEKGSYDLEVVFLQDKFYNYGKILSLSSFLIVLILILRLKKSSDLSN